MKRRPRVVVTRKLPDVVETRMMELFDCQLNLEDRALDARALAEAVRSAEVLVPTVTDHIDAAVIDAGGRPQLTDNLGKNPPDGPDVPLLEVKPDSLQSPSSASPRLQHRRYSAIDPPCGAAQAASACSNLHLAAELDHPVRRNAEKFRRRQRVAMHGLEQFAADGVKARASLRHDGHSAHEERGLHHVELKVLRAAPLEHSRHVGVLHEAVIGDHGKIGRAHV